MGEGRGPSRNGTATSRLRRIFAVIAILAVGLTVVTLNLIWRRTSTPLNANGCLEDRRRGLYAMRQSVEGFHAGGSPCGRKPHADVEWIQGPEGQAGGEHTCVGYERVCLDQGALVMHDERYNMVNGSDLPTFDITNLEVCPKCDASPSLHSV
jgi:hypothetical protein